MRTVIVNGRAELPKNLTRCNNPCAGVSFPMKIADSNAAGDYAESSQDWESVLFIVTPKRIISQNFQD